MYIGILVLFGRISIKYIIRGNSPPPQQIRFFGDPRARARWPKKKKKIIIIIFVFYCISARRYITRRCITVITITSRVGVYRVK